MRKFLLVAAFLVAFPTFATDYTISTPGAPADALLEGMRFGLNATTCESVGLPSDCTQPQARARNADLMIFSTVQDMLTRYTYKGLIAQAKDIKVQNQAAAFCRWWNRSTTTTADRNSVCTKAEMGAGCDLCQ